MVKLLQSIGSSGFLRLIVILVLVLPVASDARPSRATPSESNDESIDVNAFSMKLGVEIASSSASPLAVYIAEAKPTYLRMHLRWSQSALSNGRLDQNSTEWLNLIAAIQAVRAHYTGGAIILTIKGTPSQFRHPNWAGWECGRIGDQSIHEFGEYVKDVAYALRSGNPYGYPEVRLFELWNEPDADRKLMDPLWAEYLGCWVDTEHGYDSYSGGYYYSTVLDTFFRKVKEGTSPVPALVLAGAMQTYGSPDAADYLRGFLDYIGKTQTCFTRSLPCHANRHSANSSSYRRVLAVDHTPVPCH